MPILVAYLDARVNSDGVLAHELCEAHVPCIPDVLGLLAVKYKLDSASSTSSNQKPGSWRTLSDYYVTDHSCNHTACIVIPQHIVHMGHPTERRRTSGQTLTYVYVIAATHHALTSRSTARIKAQRRPGPHMPVHQVHHATWLTWCPSTSWLRY